MGFRPAIAIEQKTASHNPRSTVGTVTEIYDYLRLLYARVGEPHCPRCGRPITAWSMTRWWIRSWHSRRAPRILILAPLTGGGKGSRAGLLTQLKKEGFARVRSTGSSWTSTSRGAFRPPVPAHRSGGGPSGHQALREKRLSDSLELALARGNGNILVDVVGGEAIQFNEASACATCGIRHPELTPASFSFNSPHGACATCDGLGSTTAFDPNGSSRIRTCPCVRARWPHGKSAPARRSSISWKR